MLPRMPAPGEDRLRGVHWRHGYGSHGLERGPETATGEAQRLVRDALGANANTPYSSEENASLQRTREQCASSVPLGAAVPAVQAPRSEATDRFQHLPQSHPEMIGFRQRFARQCQSGSSLSRVLRREDCTVPALSSPSKGRRDHGSGAGEVLARAAARVVEANSKAAHESHIQLGRSHSVGSAEYISETSGCFTTPTPATQYLVDFNNSVGRRLRSSTLDLAPGAIERTAKQWQTHQAAELARCAAVAVAAAPSQAVALPPQALGRSRGASNVHLGRHVCDHSTSSQLIGRPSPLLKVAAESAPLHGEHPLHSHQWRPWAPHPNLH